MKALIIIGSVCAFLFAIGMIRINVSAVSEGDFTLKLKILFFRKQLFPKPPPDPKKYTLKQLEKQKRKEEKKKLKEEKKKKGKTEEEAPPEEKKEETFSDKLDSIREIVDLVLAILKKTLKPLGKYLRIKVARLNITVAGDDAAKTAIIYGYVSQGLAYICELLSHATNFKKTDDRSVTVDADFLSGKSSCVINITVGIRIWQILSLGIKALAAFIKHKCKHGSKKKTTDTEEGTKNGKQQSQRNDKDHA